MMPISSVYAATVTEKGRTFVRIEMRLDGQTKTWAEYDYAQLENLIAMLKERLEEVAWTTGQFPPKTQDTP